jgi:hypothetical protein
MFGLGALLPAKTQVLVGLLQKYGDFGSDALTPAIVGEFVSAAGVSDVEVSSPQFDQVLATLKEANINKIADLVGQPDTLGAVVGIFKPKDPPQDRIHKCTKCGNYDLILERE